MSPILHKEVADDTRNRKVLVDNTCKGFKPNFIVFLDSFFVLGRRTLSRDKCIKKNMLYYKETKTINDIYLKIHTHTTQKTIISVTISFSTSPKKESAATTHLYRYSILTCFELSSLSSFTLVASYNIFS